MRICVDYRDLNRASPKDIFPLPNIHILIDNCTKHEVQSFVDCYASYHQILMDEEDAQKMALITPWGVYHYRVMPFGLKNASATYMRAMTSIFHDMMHREIEVLRKYDLKLNPAKCAFGGPTGKLLGFIISRRGIELDPTNIKAIQELLPPKTNKKVMSFLGRLNYNGRFIAQSTVIVEPILKLLKKDAPTKWTGGLSEIIRHNQKILVKTTLFGPAKTGNPFTAIYVNIRKCFWIFLGRKGVLCFNLGVPEIKTLYGCIHDSFDLKNGPPKKAVKGKALADLLAGSLVDDNPVPLWTYFPDEEVMTIEGEKNEDELGWKVYFNGAVNFKGLRIGAVLVSDSGQYYPVAAKLNFNCTNNMAEYEAFIIDLRLALDMDVRNLQRMGHKKEKIIPYVGLVQRLADRFQEVKFKNIPRTQNEFADALATIASMIQHPDSKYIDPVRVKIRDQPAHCAFVEVEIDGKSWYINIKMYLEKGEYPEGITINQKKTIKKLAVTP
ncbi:uncharacterized protein LOC132643972 [Lycium barbarum]|uniref:uncharacterized protein LOC132643972 n=1 Tax=Lycium barbarum TaxID=112863 RepID=UPI00293F7458|nr:uncharacterized protein LOC132643972 [Lycium barbarum]